MLDLIMGRSLSSFIVVFFSDLLSESCGLLEQDRYSLLQILTHPTLPPHIT